MSIFAVSELKDYSSGWDSQPYEYDYYLDAAYVSVGKNLVRAVFMHG